MGTHHRVSAWRRARGAVVGIALAGLVRSGMAAELASSSAAVTAPGLAASAPPATTQRKSDASGSGKTDADAMQSDHASHAASAASAESGQHAAPRATQRAAQTAQETPDDSQHGSGANAKPPSVLPVPPEASSVTHHAIQLNGQKIDYTATAGNLLLHNEDGEATASVFYVAYTADSKTPGSRPVTFLFNGGPGAGTVFLLMGSVGPKRARTSSPAITPPAPYVLADNPDSLLDKSDLVFIDAVGTGFSRIVGHGTSKNFWGVDRDLDAFEQFIERYLTVNQRWNSPKYLFGESYGTARAAMLAYQLSEHNIGLNGVILMSSVLNYADFLPGSDFESESYLPSFAAVAWYHDKLVPKPPSLPAFLDEVRSFARGPYAEALAQGDALPDSERDAIAARVASYTGLDVQYIKQTDLRIWPSRFRKQLLRSESHSVGRFDARFEGSDYDDASERPDYDASVTSVASAFDAALHQHLAQDLHFTPTDRYRIFNDEAGRQWDMKHRQWWGEQLTLPYAAADLAEVMRQNPQLRVLSVNGYFDLATPFFATEYDLVHMGLPPSLRGNLQIAYYPTGHMIYLDDGALHTLKGDLARFYGEAGR